MSLSLYIAAHPDDWQLFRGWMGYNDLKYGNNIRTSFIYLSAGDAGKEDWWWQAREQGAVGSVASVLGITPPVNRGTISIRGKNICIQEMGNSSRSYFLRLPDGNTDGMGYPNTGKQSILQLYNSAKQSVIPNSDCQAPSDWYSSSKSQINSLDGNSYTWIELIDTINAIIDQEEQIYTANFGSADMFPWVNAPEWCWSIGNYDHHDHKATAYAVKQVFDCRENNSSYGRALWVSYLSDNGDPGYVVRVPSPNTDGPSPWILSGDYKSKQEVVECAYATSAYNWVKDKFGEGSDQEQAVKTNDYLGDKDRGELDLFGGYGLCRRVLPGTPDVVPDGYYLFRDGTPD
jgi:hypothetical protein